MVHRSTLLLPLLFTGCVGLLYADAMKQATTPTKVVPASEAPAPPPGSGWYCFDIHTFDESGSSSSSDACLRTLSSCRTVAMETSRSSGSRRVQAGTCVAQPTAACSYFWGTTGGGQWDCERELAACSAKVGRPSGPYVEKQSECIAVP